VEEYPEGAYEYQAELERRLLSIQTLLELQ